MNSKQDLPSSSGWRKKFIKFTIMIIFHHNNCHSSLSKKDWSYENNHRDLQDNHHQNNDEMTNVYRCVSHKVDHTMIDKGELAIHGVPECKLSWWWRSIATAIWTATKTKKTTATTTKTLMEKTKEMANLETNSCVFSLLLRSEELGVLVT